MQFDPNLNEVNDIGTDVDIINITTTGGGTTPTAPSRPVTPLERTQADMIPSLTASKQKNSSVETLERSKERQKGNSMKNAEKIPSFVASKDMSK